MKKEQSVDFGPGFAANRKRRQTLKFDDA
jgi:hypothetical protein